MSNARNEVWVGLCVLFFVLGLFVGLGYNKVKEVSCAPEYQCNGPIETRSKSCCP